MAQDYELAFRIIAELHDKGMFFPQSDQKAYEFYKKSSDLGSGKGAYHAGNFAESLGDLKGALVLIKLGAERDYPDAQANLGIIYDGTITEYKDNNIVAIDLEKSMEWYLKAAQQDFHYAIYRVGFNYSTGRGVPKSLASAQYWHKRGARMGMGESMMSLSDADQEEIRKEQLQSAKTKAAKGDAEAQYTLSVAYRDGKDVEKSTALSEHWLVKAAAQDMPEAMADLAEIYDDGQGSPRNAQKAKALYMELAKNKQEAVTVVTRAIRAYNNDDYDLAFALAKPYADNGYDYAQNIIGKMYNFGRGVPTSKDKSLFYFKLASDAGFAEAQHNLGFLYEYSFNNPAEAARWYQKAANQSHVRSLKSLALMYSSGRGVTENYSKAAELYGRAAAAGDEDAASSQRTALYHQRRDQQANARTQAERQVLAAERKKFETQEQRRREKQAPQAAPTRTYTFPEPKVNKWSLAYLFTPRPQTGYSHNYNSSSNYSGSNSSYRSGYSTAIDSGAATRSVYAIAPPPRKWHDGN
jgi:TPR repeat protein